MDEKIEQAYYAIIPANVRYDKDLPPNAKLLYGEITALCNKCGYCWATNDYFALLYGVTSVSISKWVNLLAEKGYINAITDKQDGNKRYITIFEYPIKEKFNTPIKEKFNTPIKEKFKQNITRDTNNTRYNTTSDNITLDNNIQLVKEKQNLYIDKTIEKKEITKKETQEDEIVVGVIEYLNEKAHAHYKATTNAYRKAILAVLHKGYLLEDIKTVIDKKCCEWLGTDYEKYLTPITLFRDSNFDRYLNQPIRVNDKPTRQDNLDMLDRLIENFGD